jgi:hypothetical protein
MNRSLTDMQHLFHRPSINTIVEHNFRTISIYIIILAIQNIKYQFNLQENLSQYLCCIISTQLSFPLVLCFVENDANNKYLGNTNIHISYYN